MAQRVKGNVRFDIANFQLRAAVFVLLASCAASAAWALWLSFALTRWIRWAWSVFARDGSWHGAPPRPLPAADAS